MNIKAKIQSMIIEKLNTICLYFVIKTSTETPNHQKRVPTLRTTAQKLSIRTQTYQTDDSLVDYQFLVPKWYTASTRKLTSQTDDSPSHLDSVPIRLPYLGISIHAWRKRPLVSYHQSVVTHYFSYSVLTFSYNKINSRVTHNFRLDPGWIPI